MMTVRELIDELTKLPQDYVVIIQKDGEGNSYSPLEGADGDNCVYEPDSTYSGTVKFKELTRALRKSGYTAEDVGTGENCVVLYPTN